MTGADLVAGKTPSGLEVRVGEDPHAVDLEQQRRMTDVGDPHMLSTRTARHRDRWRAHLRQGLRTTLGESFDAGPRRGDHGHGTGSGLGALARQEPLLRERGHVLHGVNRG